MADSTLQDSLDRVRDAVGDAIADQWNDLTEDLPTDAVARASRVLERDTTVADLAAADPRIETHLHNAVFRIAEQVAHDTVSQLTDAQRKAVQQACGIRRRRTSSSDLTDTLLEHPGLSSFVYVTALERWRVLASETPASAQV